MITNRLEFLNAHFKCQYVELAKYPIIRQQFESYYNEQTKGYQFGLGIIEISTNQVLVLGLANEIDNNIPFEKLLSQMPNLSLQNILMLLALVHSKKILTYNPYERSEDYPSEFASELLKDTNGYVLFRYQMMQLLSSCLTVEENNTQQIVEYTRQFNNRNASFFKKIENLHLPDGYCLADLLLKYTIVGNENDSFGFVSHPMYRQAYQFIQQTKKYLTA
ncbi:MAG: hypothetical protein ACOVQE_08565 [Chitinophagaceae bacterium]